MGDHEKGKTPKGMMTDNNSLLRQEQGYMNRKSVGLIIFWWSEVIISIRVLLFTMPVIINKLLAENFILADLENRFIILLTLTAIFYFLAGLTSIGGFRFWKFLHFSAAIFTILLTVSSLFVQGQIQAGAGMYYFYPVLFSIGITLLAVILGNSKYPANTG